MERTIEESLILVSYDMPLLMNVDLINRSSSHPLVEVMTAKWIHANICLSSILPAVPSLAPINPPAIMCCHTDTHVHLDANGKYDVWVAVEHNLCLLLVIDRIWGGQSVVHSSSARSCDLWNQHYWKQSKVTPVWPDRKETKTCCLVSTKHCSRRGKYCFWAAGEYLQQQAGVRTGWGQRGGSSTWRVTEFIRMKEHRSDCF